jgi:hypothetical protein
MTWWFLLSLLPTQWCGWLGPVPAAEPSATYVEPRLSTRVVSREIIASAGLARRPTEAVESLAVWARPEAKSYRCFQVGIRPGGGGGWSGMPPFTIEEAWIPSPWFTPMTPAGTFYWRRESFSLVQQASAIYSSDLTGEKKGKELAKLIWPGMTREEVDILLEDGNPCWSHGEHRLFTRVVCLDLGLAVVFDGGDEVVEVESDLRSLGQCKVGVDMEPPLPPRESPQVFNFWVGWCR